MTDVNATQYYNMVFQYYSNTTQYYMFNTTQYYIGWFQYYIRCFQYYSMQMNVLSSIGLQYYSILQGATCRCRVHDRGRTVHLCQMQDCTSILDVEMSQMYRSHLDFKRALTSLNNYVHLGFNLSGPASATVAGPVRRGP